MLDKSVKKVHFPNLNALRFLAAAIVIVHHIEQVKFIKGYDSLWHNSAIVLIGKLGVDLFFVLSGFLITSLLIIEKEECNKVYIRKFLMRRILRIWPLYFIIVVLSFFIMPYFNSFNLGFPFANVSHHFYVSLLLYILFLPHVQTFLFGPIPYGSQSWSIGIEEQFYLVWPFIINFFSERKTKLLIVWFVIIYLLSCLTLKILHSQTVGSIFYDKIIYKLLLFFMDGLKFDCLLIGSFFAFIHKSPSIHKYITNRFFQFGVYFIEVVLILIGYDFGGFYWEAHAILYGFIILNLVRADTSLINIEYPILGYLGKISYGMYMYHFLIINISINFLSYFNCFYLLYPTVFTLTILISALSYKYIEKFFLKRKNAYTIIPTG